MIVYHVTKLRSSYEAIYASQLLLPGRNVTDKRTTYVHLSTVPFYPGSWALDVIGADTNEGWIFTVEISDDTILIPDPSDEGEIYNGPWVVSTEPIPIVIKSIHFIDDVQAWESGEIEATEIPTTFN